MPTDDDDEVHRKLDTVARECAGVDILRSKYLSVAENLSGEIDLLLRVLFEIPNRKVHRFHMIILPRMTLRTRVESLDVLTKVDRPPIVTDLLAKVKEVVRYRNFLAHASIGPGIVDPEALHREERAEWEVQATIRRSGIFTRTITTSEVQEKLLVATEVSRVVRALVATVFGNPNRDYEPASWAETISNPPYSEDGILHAPEGFHELFKMTGPAPPGVEPIDDFDF